MTSCPVRRIPALIILAAALVAGCSSTPKDDPRNDSATLVYQDAKEDMESGSYESAIRKLNRVEALAAGTLLAQQAQLDMAYVQWKTAERAPALATLDRFIKFNPSSPALDYALYLQGVVNFNDNLGIFGSLSRQDLSERDQQASRDAWQSFKQLVDQFPASRYTPDAQVRMDYIVNSLASHELHAARYYYRRGAYVAAVNRAQRAVSDYQTSPSAEEALYILAISYNKLDLPELRDSAQRVLKTNFPGSRFLTEGLVRPDKAWWQFW